MPLALYTIKDSGLSSIFVISSARSGRMLINTAFGVRRAQGMAQRRAHARGRHFRRAFTIILPAAAPTILTGMAHIDRHRLAVIGRPRCRRRDRHRLLSFWNEWNNLSITNVISASW